MASYEIGISGIHAAQKALTVIGNNLANAATEGYHRQELQLQPAPEAYTHGLMIGQGVDNSRIARKINQVLESEMLRQGAWMAQIERQLDSLRVIESAFGEISGDGISKALDAFFTAFDNLAVRPNDVNLQSEVLSKAQTLVTVIQNVATAIDNVKEMAYSEARWVVERINLLVGQIAAYNQDIYNQKIRGFDANNTMDQRDRLIAELNKLISVRTISRDTGMVDVVASDVSLVVGSQVTLLELGITNQEGQYQLGIRPAQTYHFQTAVSGGSLGGIFSIYNQQLQELSERLDSLALALISSVNRIHVQGVGTEGSFTSLIGWTVTTENLSQFIPPIQPGSFYVRVTDSLGTTRSYEVVINANDTLQDVAARLAAIPGLDQQTRYASGRLFIGANAGYTFDFLSGVRTEPVATIPNPLGGAGGLPEQAPPLIRASGIYTGTTNQRFSCTVDIPNSQPTALGNGLMTITVRDSSNNVISTVNVGQGYIAGQPISIGQGIQLTFSANGTSPGYFNDGDTFVIEAIANSDPTGFLAAVGINTFFSGTSASSIDMSDRIKNAGHRIASAGTYEKIDNLNALRIARIADQSQESLNGMSIKSYYRQTAVELGNQIAILNMQYQNTEGILQNLKQQREAVSGVDINEQASQMMMYERMFQAMAKFLNVVFETQKIVMTIIS